MAVDVTELELRVKSLEVQTAEKRLDKFEKQAQKTESATDGLTKAFKGMLAPLAALVSAAAIGAKLVETERQFNRLNAGLITATKSAANAEDAFDALQQFAQNTPYDLAQAVDGFTKLVNLGLTPSEKALMSYGNTASAMGKDLNQMIEAVADAATGEFERLKEFGIKSSVQGKQVTFTFQGVKTSIGNNAAEIEKYLTDLGENQFAGAMQQRMDTLDGSLANLEDNWDSLARTINKAGVGDLMKDAVDLANVGMQELIDLIASGELQGELEALGNKWDGWGKDIGTMLSSIGSLFTDETGFWERTLDANIENMIATFRDFPENVRAFIQIMTVEVLAGFDKVQAYSKAFQDGIQAIFTDDTFEGVGSRLESQLRIVNQARQGSIESILEERDTALGSYDAQREAAKKLREEYDAAQAAKDADKTDRLVRYKTGGSTEDDGGLTDAEKKKAAAKVKQQKKEFDDLVASLNTEEESIEASYNKRRAIIEKNTTAESSARANLMARLDKDHQKELDQLHNIEDAYEKRLRLFQEYTAIEEAGWDAQTKAANEYQKQMETLWQAQMSGVISGDQHEASVKRITEAYEKQTETASTGYFDLEELGKQAARNTQDAFADFLFDPFQEGIDGMLVGFIKVVQRMAAEAAAAQLTKGLFGSAGGGSGSGWLGSLVSLGTSLFSGMAGGSAVNTASIGAQASSYSNLSGWQGPGRAAGGPTVGGQLYQVEEKGPEVYESGGKRYLLDGKAGNVSPLGSGASGGMGDVNVELTVIVQSDGSTTETSSANDNAQGNQLAQMMKGVATKAIHDEMRPGGIIWNMKEGQNG